jgi:hypothetical protein
MQTPSRPVLHLKGNEPVPADEDRRVELGEFEALLPCRKYAIDYKIAVLGQVSPTLEFLLRLVKSVPGIADETAAAFFGYSRGEMAYVVEEALGPGYIDSRSGKFWITTAGESLFREGEKEPTIFSVESRGRSFGFDLLSLSPQQPRHLDSVEFSLPELPVPDPAATGQTAARISDRFRHFFLELAERQDREQPHRPDLYSIDRVVPQDRFQSPVRIRAYAQASKPSIAEIDLSVWRPDHEVVDRREIETAAARFIEDMKTSAKSLDAAVAYGKLIDFAPDFLQEYSTRAGLSVNRYWREAVRRAGEPRTDRRTIPIVGSLCLRENLARLLSIIDYGLHGKQELPETILSVAPQIPNWGATTVQREILSEIKRIIGSTASGSDQNDMRSVCLFNGRPPRYLERAFDEVRTAAVSEFPAALEVLVVPHVAAFAIVHAPIGAVDGYPVPLGLASFDLDVVDRVDTYVSERADRYAANG